MSWTTEVRRHLVLGGLLIGLVLVAVWTLPLQAWLQTADAWVEVNPRSGALIFVTGVVIGTVALIPGAVLALSGGFLFSFTNAVALLTIGITLGATLACMLGRSVLRGLITSRLAGNARLRALDRALNRKGFQIVVLSRLSWLLPFNLLNYAFGLTGIGLRQYAFATGLGMLPELVLYAYLGNLARNVDQLKSNTMALGGPARTLLLVGLAVLILVVVLVQRAAARELKNEMALETDVTGRS